MVIHRRRPAWLLAGLWLLFVPASVRALDVTIDRTTRYQTIDGFGFFGAKDVWWGYSANMVDDVWATQVVRDLGISMWRNEYYPPADALDAQDADWNKQKPVAQTLKRISDANHVPLKVILTVWSPPSIMKCTYQSGTWLPIEGTFPQHTKGGNTLCKSSWDAFADWLIAGLQMYQNAGVDVYGLSIQNEPYFTQPYNSCFYSQDYYTQTLAYVAPKVKAAFRNVKIIAAENMLAMEAGSSKNYFYSGTLAKNRAALASVDVLTMHGYDDGVAATPSSQMATFWSTANTSFAQPLNKPLWMTETSGYADTWGASAINGTSYPGASDLAYAMFAALYYGHASGWIWWQGSSLSGIDVYSLMSGTSARSKRYYVSKQFYRFIRPGAAMVKTVSADSSVLAASFDHPAMGAFTTLLINSSSQAKVVNLVGAGLPSTFTMYRTSATEDCVNEGVVSAASIVLTPNSVNTLVSGNVYELAPPPVPALPHTAILLEALALLGSAWCLLRRAASR